MIASFWKIARPPSNNNMEKERKRGELGRERDGLCCDQLVNDVIHRSSSSKQVDRGREREWVKRREAFLAGGRGGDGRRGARSVELRRRSHECRKETLQISTFFSSRKKGSTVLSSHLLSAMLKD